MCYVDEVLITLQAYRPEETLPLEETRVIGRQIFPFEFEIYHGDLKHRRYLPSNSSPLFTASPSPYEPRTPDSLRGVEYRMSISPRGSPSHTGPVYYAASPAPAYSPIPYGTTTTWPTEQSHILPTSNFPPHRQIVPHVTTNALMGQSVTAIPPTGRRQTTPPSTRELHMGRGTVDSPITVASGSSGIQSPPPVISSRRTVSQWLQRIHEVNNEQSPQQ